MEWSQFQEIRRHNNCTQNMQNFKKWLRSSKNSLRPKLLHSAARELAWFPLACVGWDKCKLNLSEKRRQLFLNCHLIRVRIQHHSFALWNTYKFITFKLPASIWTCKQKAFFRDFFFSASIKVASDLQGRIDLKLRMSLLIQDCVVCTKVTVQWFDQYCLQF